MRFVERESSGYRRVQRVDRLQVDQARDSRRDAAHLLAESAPPLAADHEHGSRERRSRSCSAGRRIRVERDDLNTLLSANQVSELVTERTRQR